MEDKQHMENERKHDDHESVMIERAVARERQAEEEKKRKENSFKIDSIWRRSLLHVKVMKAFSEAGDRARAKRKARRMWKVAIITVIVVNHFVNVVKHKSVMEKWQRATLKIRAARRFSAKKFRWKFACDEQQKQLKRCEICNLRNPLTVLHRQSQPQQHVQLQQQQQQQQQHSLLPLQRDGESADGARSVLSSKTVENESPIGSSLSWSSTNSNASSPSLRPKVKQIVFPHPSEDSFTMEEDDDSDVEEVHEVDDHSEDLINFDEEWDKLLEKAITAKRIRKEKEEQQRKLSEDGEVEEEKIVPEDFHPLRIVGTGGSGQVYLVQHIKTKQRFAMKVLNKAEVVASGRIERVITEREILTKAQDSPFMTRLKFAFHSEDMLFFVMEYCCGGNLHEVMLREHEIRNRTMSDAQYRQAMDAAAEGLGLLGALNYAGYFCDKQGSPLPPSSPTPTLTTRWAKKKPTLQEFGLIETHVQFLVAEVIEALRFLHDMGVVYRDLKPQNVMLNVDGHIRLGDFGVCKLGQFERDKGRVILRSNSFIGTVEYMSPEVVAGDPQSNMVDIWGLGVLVFELLFGTTPFNPTEEDGNRTLFRSILNVEEVLKFPAFAYRNHPQAVDFIKSLLRVSPKRRSSLNQAAGHDFLKSINWANLANSSGFHKLTPRIHLHRTEKRQRPTSLPKDKNLFNAWLLDTTSASSSSSSTPTIPLPPPPPDSSRPVSGSYSSPAIMIKRAVSHSSSAMDLLNLEKTTPCLTASGHLLEPSPTEKRRGNKIHGLRRWIKKTVRRHGKRLSRKNKLKEEAETETVVRHTHSLDDMLRVNVNEGKSQQLEQHQRRFHSGHTIDSKTRCSSENDENTETNAIGAMKRNYTDSFIGFEWNCSTLS